MVGAFPTTTILGKVRKLSFDFPLSSARRTLSDFRLLLLLSSASSSNPPSTESGSRALSSLGITTFQSASATRISSESFPLILSFDSRLSSRRFEPDSISLLYAFPKRHRLLLRRIRYPTRRAAPRGGDWRSRKEVCVRTMGVEGRAGLCTSSLSLLLVLGSRHRNRDSN